MSLTEVLRAEKVTKEFKRGRKEIVKALDDVDFNVREAEMVLIMGPSGSGKSTLLNVLAGLDLPTRGTVTYGDLNICELNEADLTKFRRDKVGFVFQSWELLDHLTALENMEIAVYPTDLSDAEVRTRAMQFIREMRLEDRLDHRPPHMSGGEQQRVGIGRALIKKPRILLCDEPTGNLDYDTGREIMGRLKTICRAGTSVVIATHNEELVSFADRVVRLSNGRITY